MNFLKSLLEKQKSRTQHNKELDISSTFYVKEKDGKLWILHNGYAIQEVGAEQTASEIVNIINNYRTTAIKY